MTDKEKIAIIKAANAAKRAKFNLEFMVLMLNTGREKKAANAYNKAVAELNELIEMENVK